VKGICAFAVSESADRDLVELLRSFDRIHPGSTFQVLTDSALPPDLSSTLARIAAWSPVVGPRKFDHD
jgi:hypothetical protein